METEEGQDAGVDSYDFDDWNAFKQCIEYLLFQSYQQVPIDKSS